MGTRRHLEGRPVADEENHGLPTSQIDHEWDSPAAGFVEAAAADALKRFISPAIERDPQ